MSKKNKHKHKHHAPPSTAELKARVERTRQEGRYQQALELVKLLFKAEPTPEHFGLLKDTYLQRAIQLRTQGYLRDAATVLEMAASLDEKDPTWLEKLSGEMARTGDVARSFRMLARLPESARTAVMAPLADSLMLDHKAGRDHAPADLKAELERITTAFRQVEAGQDEEARQTLAPIGLRSPFLEWKLLLRGLQAYYHNDDERARENWQRLDPGRLPARLAAPFRAAIDPAYRDAQPAPTRQALHQQLDWTQGGGLQPQMRSVQKALNEKNGIASAYRQAENLLPALRQQAPHLVSRLARVLYWAIIQGGPENIGRYRRVFGTPPEDPEFNRLQAIAYEENDNLEDAHELWQRYEREIARAPHTWPGDQARIARGLVWLHMGQNADSIPGAEQRKKLPAFLRNLPGFPEPLKPGAEKCFEKSIELAPEILEAHEELFGHLRRTEKIDKAIQAGRRLLERFPDHVETLRQLAELEEKNDHADESLELYLRALKHNPLDRQLRGRVAQAHMSCGRVHAEQKAIDKARPHYEAALALNEPSEHGSVYCRWAAAELKADETDRAEQLLVKARETSPGELFIRYILLVEASRLKLPGKLKTRFTREFNADVTDQASPELAVALVTYLAGLYHLGVEYHGMKAHTKKILELADRVDKKAFTEEQLVKLISSFLLIETPSRLMGRFLDEARRLHPKNPYFPYYEAVYQMGDDPEAAAHWKVGMLLDEAEQLAAARTGEPGIAAMLEDIKHRRRTLHALNPFLGGLMNLFGAGGGMGPEALEDFLFGFGGDEYDDEDDDEDGYF